MPKTLLRAALTALVLIAGVQSVDKVAPTAVEAASLSDLVYMQIVAHQDDDFLFMNPDVANQLAAAVSTVTVYVTAGQTCGATVVGMPCTLAAPILTREQFAAARQNGIRAAYAQMAQVANTWTRTLIQPDDIHTVELYTLVAAPRVRLLFMNLPDGGDPLAPHTNALSNMFQDSTYQTDTIVPLCDAYTRTVIPSCDDQTNQPPVPLQYYNRGAIVSVISALVRKYQPIEIRTLDPQPFQKLTADATGFEVSFDNLDHTATARFVDEVLASYHGPKGSGRFTVNYYKGYSFADYPANLGQADLNRKLATASTYLPYDPNYTLNQAGYDKWYPHVWERYAGSTTWLERASDGRLVAASVEDRRVKIWYENTPGGSWSGPIAIWSGSPIAPHLTLLKRPNGLLQIFALRLPLQLEQWFPAPSAPPQDVITAVQVPGQNHPIRFGPWHSVGSPDAGQFVGAQTAAVDGNGRTFVFAKDSQGLVSYAFSEGEKWSAWDSTSFATQVQAFVGSVPVSQDIVDGIAAITRDDGLIEVFATMRTGFDGSPGALWHFVQNPNATTFSYDPAFSSDPAFALERAASAPTVTKNQNGQVEIFYREAADATTGNPGGRVLTVYQSNGLIYGPTVLYGDAGAGPVAAIRRESTGEIMLFERNFWGGISETNQTAPNGNFFLQWQILGNAVNEYPAAATDNFGRAVLVVKGIDGKLYMKRELSGTSLGSFGPWTVIGG